MMYRILSIKPSLGLLLAALFQVGCITTTAQDGAHRDYPYEHLPQDQASGAGSSPATSPTTNPGPQTLPYPQPSEPSSVPSQPAPPIRPSQPVAPARPAAGPAVVALMKTADQRYESGDWDGAAANIERALRIEPRNAELWFRLAAVRLEQQQYAQAEALAQKSLALSGPYPRIQAANWSLIAESRRARGDQRGAGEAEQQVDAINSRPI